MRVGVKYCGGCNPRYDRTALLERLRRDFPALEIGIHKEGAQPDFALVLAGCPASCVEHGGFNGRLGKMVLESPADYEAVAALLRKLGA